MPIRTSIDVNRLAEAIKQPGMDTRMWVALAVVTDVAFDAKHGMFADVKMLDTGAVETVLVGSDYAGDDFGEWPTLDKDDVIMVGVPWGDLGVGAIYLRRIWSGSHKPPAEFHNANSSDAMDAATDRTIVVKANTKLRVVARAGASVSIECQDGGQVNLTSTKGSTVNVTSEDVVTVKAPTVNLGTTPGSGVARIGDIGIGSALGVIVPPSLVPLPVLPVPAAPGFVPVTVQLVSGADSVKA